jgi:hypothetical protein
VKSGARDSLINMNHDVKILKKLKMSEIVIRPENIRVLAEKVYEKYRRDLERNQNVSVNFILKGFDGTQYESESIDIFSVGGILDTRRVIATEMNYYNHTEDKRISIDLEHTTIDYGISNVAVISGRDEIWANGFLKSLEDIVSNWEKQVSWPYRYKWPLIILFTIGIGLLYLNFLDFVFSYVIVIHPISPRPQWTIDFLPAIISMYYLGGFIFGFWPSFYIVDKIQKLYPCIEFRFGPEHSHIEARRRIMLYKIISIGVIPLIISLIIELIKL